MCLQHLLHVLYAEQIVKLCDFGLYKYNLHLILTSVETICRGQNFSLSKSFVKQIAKHLLLPASQM